MFPNELLEFNSLNALLFYTACLGALLFIGVILRIKVGLFRKLFLPASLIAGIVGFLLGPYVLNFLPKGMFQTWSSFPAVLITVIFAPMLIGVSARTKRFKEAQVLQQLVWTWQTSFVQWGVAILLTGLLLTPIFRAHPVFGSLTEMGWSGGPATPAALNDLFTDLGFPEGSSLGVTIATIGLLVGVISGVIMINFAVRKGYTSYIRKEDANRKETITDIIPRKLQKASSYETIKSDVTNGYTFHLALICIAIVIGWILKFALIDKIISGIPLFPMAMIGGFLLNLVLQRTPLSVSIDTNTFRNIQSIALDLTVVTSVAAVSLPVVLDYFWPLLLTTIVMLLVMVFCVFYIGPRLFQNDWFEHTIMLYGVMTGLVATGYVLLRIVDPDLESDVSLAYGLKSPFSSPFASGGLLTVLMPTLIVTYGSLTVGSVSLIIFILIFVVMKWFGLYGRFDNTYFNKYNQGKRVS